jgi:hypothetical protein
MDIRNLTRWGEISTRDRVMGGTAEIANEVSETHKLWVECRRCTVSGDCKGSVRNSRPVEIMPAKAKVISRSADRHHPKGNVRHSSVVEINADEGPGDQQSGGDGQRSVRNTPAVEIIPGRVKGIWRESDISITRETSETHQP